MNNQLRVLTIVACSLNLTACVVDRQQAIGGYDPYSKQPSTMLYPEGYENPVNDTTIYDTTPLPSSQAPITSTTGVVVPETYHVSSTHGPAAVHDVDQQWVNQQNPSHYTIELAESDKASQVASVLSQAPKHARTAEVQTNKHGQTYYTGVYGTYANKEEAESALNALPSDIKRNANIESWSQVQK
jgi:septal ring-binding cell division protein DamX